jgi:hypothetical protein
MLRRIHPTAERTVTPARHQQQKAPVDSGEAIRERLLRCKDELGEAAPVGCSHVYGLWLRYEDRLALMKSADRIPISFSRSNALGPPGFSDPRCDRFVITSQHPCLRRERRSGDYESGAR